jgi:ribulose 1,5-bisphosphate synthetase/thiazole synthase
MSDKAKSEYVVESQKYIPIIFDVDVAIAGAGITGVFAAMASARDGAQTVLIERFGSLGGNIGPAMITGGGLYNEADYTLPGGLSGIPKEFIERLEAMLGDLPRNNPNISNTVSYLALKMMEQERVNLMLSAYAADPIVDDGKVGGVFVETKSGRVAVKAKVTVDATGDASLAARASAPIIRHTEAKPSFAPIIRPPHLDPKFKFLNDTSIYFCVANLDLEKYNEFRDQKLMLSDNDKRCLRNMA